MRIHSVEWDEILHLREVDEPRAEHKPDSVDSKIYFHSLAEEGDPEEILKDSNSIYETSLVQVIEVEVHDPEEKKNMNQLKK